MPSPRGPKGNLSVTNTDYNKTFATYNNLTPQLKIWWWVVFFDHFLNGRISSEILSLFLFVELKVFFVFQVFQRLYSRPSLWRCWLMVLCQGPSFAGNVRPLVVGCSSTISNNALSFTTEGHPGFGLSSRLVSPSLESLNQFCAAHLLIVSGPSISLIYLVIALTLRPCFLQVA